MTYCSGRSQCSQRGKCVWGKARRARHTLQVFSWGSHPGHTDNTCEMLSVGHLGRDSVPRVFTGVRSRGHPLPGTYQAPRIAEVSRCQHKPHCSHKQRRHSSHSDQIRWWEPSINLTSVASWGPVAQAGLSKDSSS